MHGLYFLLPGADSDAWTAYHENFFGDGGGFFFGLIMAACIGILFAFLFYFLCCNSTQTSKLANIWMWLVAMCLCGVVTWAVADNVIIGSSSPETRSDSESMFYKHSFYQANDQYLLEQSVGQPQTVVEDLTRQHNDISNALDRGGDVRPTYVINTLAFAILFFFLTSWLIKSWSRTGKTIPF